MRAAAVSFAVLLAAAGAAGCRADRPAPTPAADARGPAAPATPRHLVLVTIDTLRADRVGAYGYAPAQTPILDGLAAAGLRVDHAYAVAPVTLTSHASILTGRYPPQHGARHNGVAFAGGIPTLATTLKAAGFATGAFVAAFPLDHRFGLAAGFDVYGDHLPRGRNGRPADERPGEAVVDEALAWRKTTGAARTFLWVHLFEPHAPYGNPRDGRNAVERYDDEVAEADRQVGRLLDGLGDARRDSVIVVTGDHGESFGEHGELGHSVFVYDTTLRVPLILQGPGVPQGLVGRDVSLVDIAPTVLHWLGVIPPPTDGEMITAERAARRDGETPRTLYAETFAPYADFGWSPLRAVRAGALKYIQAPTPELYDLAADPDESRNLVRERTEDVTRLRRVLASISAAPSSAPPVPITSDAKRRLQALGYLAGQGPAPGRPLADPKERRVVASQLAEVTSGEVTGAELERTLRAILKADPGNPQAEMRLGYVLFDRGDCGGAAPLFRAAIAAKMPSADPHLGLAGCLAGARDFAGAGTVLDEAAVVEPGNPVVLANQGIVRSDGGHPAEAIEPLRQAIAIDPDFHQARFSLAIAYARAGDRPSAEREALELLRRLPADAPQRAEVERLRSALQ